MRLPTTCPRGGAGRVLLLRGGAACGRRRAVSSAAAGAERLSIRWGPGEPPLYTGTIADHFAATVAQHGDRPAVIARAPRGEDQGDAETTLTYHGLDVASNRLAASLASLGVAAGERVAVSLGNAPEFATLTYALYKLGAVLVPLNPALSPAQVVAALRHLDARVLVVAAVADLAYKPARGRCNRPLVAAVTAAGEGGGDGGGLGGERVRSEAVPSLRHVVVVDNRALHRGHDPGASSSDDRWRIHDSRGALVSYDALLGQGSAGAVVPSRPLSPSDTINIQFTSGTTSTPKAAMLTHTSILNNGALIAGRMGLDAADRIVVPPPLFHCFGSVLGYMATASAGAAILFPSPAFDPVATLRMCVDHAATGLYGVTTMLVAVLDALDRPGVLDHRRRSRTPLAAHLRKGIVAGSSVPESLMRDIYRRLGLADAVICYGMTETSPVSCMTTPSDPPAKRTSSVGRPMPHTAVKIVSPTDRSVIQPLNTRGELAAAGYLVMEGYYGDPARTAAVRVREPDPDGGSTVWMYSGDEAVMDDDGYVSITGRIKDLIIRGGENIHPLDIENCLFQLPGVQEASVLGLPDDRLGESVAVFIIPARGWATSDQGGAHDIGKDADTRPSDDGSPSQGTLTKDRVRDWVRSHLSSHLVPKHVFWASEFPKTASGKIQKFKLRDTATEALKAEG
ncbi:AMP-binding enzyme [Hirsutella rhossiliensis]|uniref:AMP-binding enzyme domain-containing protein n=1 Tax=Hirsutella rhossiliensis TaxID=111463 RepID=A0A9P8SD63_9HYPO|nr:AMP-binding enzyme domain-containing protein [Hirsutella rhossiliensis]KAH0958398.1 AMP-binding enzyme domain-containing protein [Hirsutella rhossiliensis]